MSIQVDEQSRIQFVDGNQGPRQCLAQCDYHGVAMNCVLQRGHEGMHEAHEGNLIWRERIVKERFLRWGKGADDK